eukprot:946660-Pelagomonas_calceolata.AAC.1
MSQLVDLQFKHGPGDPAVPAFIAEAAGEGSCTSCIVFHRSGCAAKTIVNFVFPYYGRGSAMPEL